MAQDECVQEFDPSLTTHKLDELNVTTLGVVNIESTGVASKNLIEDVDAETPTDDVDASGLLANVRITGDVDLTLGNKVEPYEYDDGFIDASGFEANLTVYIGENDQTVIGGEGDDTIDLVENNIDLIDLQVGGADTVVFEDTNPNTNEDGEDGEIELVPQNYTTILGFQVDGDDPDENDTIAIDVVGDDAQDGEGPFEIDLDDTDGESVAAGEEVAFHGQEAGDGNDVDLSLEGINFIKFTSQQNSADSNVQEYFDNLIGDSTITVDDACDLVLMAAWDPHIAGMVLFTVEPGDNEIEAGDDTDLVALVPMTFDEYTAFGEIRGLEFVQFPNGADTLF
jgi:hypothetical protein